MDREILARGQMFHQGEKRHQWDRQVGAYVPKTVSGLRTNFAPSILTRTVQTTHIRPFIKACRPSDGQKEKVLFR